jgi:hypothetical protein
MINTFQHQHTAHCESGVMSTLLKHHGVDLDEPMIFGLSSALTFAYLPVVQVSGMPLIAYRMPPKSIIGNTCKQLGIKLTMEKFRSAQQGMAALDRALDRQTLVGLQTSIFWLPYIPESMRFHFNAHNILVYGKAQNQYLISDPVLDFTVQCSSEDLQKARFAKGALAGKGLMYSIDKHSINADIDLKPLIRSAILKNVKNIVAPLPFIGIKGIQRLAKKIERLPTVNRDDRYKKLYLGHIVRMQEEIGTGGAGFRYMYAAFLQQSAKIYGSQGEALYQASQSMTETGDLWRKFASKTVRLCRNLNPQGFKEIAELLNQVAEAERHDWQQIKSAAKALQANK